MSIHEIENELENNFESIYVNEKDIPPITIPSTMLPPNSTIETEVKSSKIININDIPNKDIIDPPDKKKKLKKVKKVQIVVLSTLLFIGSTYVIFNS